MAKHPAFRGIIENYSFDYTDKFIHSNKKDCRFVIIKKREKA
jgi:hypothetical protein